MPHWLQTISLPTGGVEPPIEFVSFKRRATVTFGNPPSGIVIIPAKPPKTFWERLIEDE